MIVLGTVFSVFPRFEFAYAAQASFEHRAVATQPAAHGITVTSAGLDDDALAAAASSARRRATETVSSTFTAIGVSLPTAPASPVLVRVRDGQRWGPWVELGFSDDHAPDDPPTAGRGGVHSEPVWVGHADAFELNLPEDVTRPEVHLGRERRVRSRVQVAPEPAGAVPFINPRSSWGARPPSSAPAYADDFRLAVVHHSVTANNYSPGEVPGILRSIQAYHMDVNGWSDIGYNFAVDRFGGLWEAHSGGVDRMVIGGHAKGFNTGSTGVVMLGEFGAVQPSNEAVSTVASVIAWKFAVHGVDPNGSTLYTTTGSTRYAEGETVSLNRIVGHRDVGQTSCPGTYLYDRLGQIRSLASGRFAAEIELRPSRLFVGNFDGGWGDDVLVERQGGGFDPVWFSRGATAMYKANALGLGVYRPAIGDFDGDGRDDISWHGPGSTGDHWWYGHPAGFQGLSRDIAGSHLPFVGDFDGDGRDDIYYYSEGYGADVVAYGETDRTFSTADASRRGTHEPLVGDFDGDGRDDILLHDPGQGSHELLYGVGRGRFDARILTAYGSYQPFVADFDGDGNTDIFWHDPGAGGDHLWFMGARGTAHRAQQTQVLGQYTHLIGDFDGNGMADILWYAPGAPQHTMWMNVGGVFSSRVVGVGAVYQPVVFDLEGPGQPGAAFADILWYSPAGSTIWQGAAAGFRGIAT